MKNVKNMNTDETVAFNFKRLLDENGIRQKDYAQKHNIDPSVVSKWINNKRPMTASEIKDAADEFGVTVNDLYYAGTDRKRLEVTNSEYLS